MNTPDAAVGGALPRVQRAVRASSAEPRRDCQPRLLVLPHGSAGEQSRPATVLPVCGSTASPQRGLHWGRWVGLRLNSKYVWSFESKVRYVLFLHAILGTFTKAPTPMAFGLIFLIFLKKIFESTWELIDFEIFELWNKCRHSKRSRSCWYTNIFYRFVTHFPCKFSKLPLNQKYLRCYCISSCFEYIYFDCQRHLVEKM